MVELIAKSKFINYSIFQPFNLSTLLPNTEPTIYFSSPAFEICPLYSSEVLNQAYPAFRAYLSLRRCATVTLSISISKIKFSKGFISLRLLAVRSPLHLVQKFSLYLPGGIQLQHQAFRELHLRDQDYTSKWIERMFLNLFHAVNIRIKIFSVQTITVIAY